MKTDLLSQYVSLQKALLREKAELESRLSEIIKLIGAGEGGQGAAEGNSTGGISTAGRERIAEAQRRRWAKYHAEHGKKPVHPPTRFISEAGKARIAAAQRARWAKFHAEQAH